MTAADCFNFGRTAYLEKDWVLTGAGLIPNGCGYGTKGPGCLTRWSPILFNPSLFVTLYCFSEIFPQVTLSTMLKF